MRTRVGLEDTVTGMLINNIDECNYTSGLARKMAKEILDYLAEEENLIIPHVSGCYCNDCDKELTGGENTEELHLCIKCANNR